MALKLKLKLKNYLEGLVRKITAGMDGYLDKAAKLAHIANSFKEGISILKISNNDLFGGNALNALRENF
jgi:hypothetical protein